ncbi:MAG: hypothetical protein MUC85_08230 [Anaerolineales bacterium]|nr:hypothetical protein [Anaerolineales bacterium]
MPLYYLSVASGYVFASARAGGLGVIDVSNPASPVEVGFFTTFGSADLLIISGNHAYLSDSGVGLRRRIHRAAHGRYQ